jgi:hypothetical protein
MKKIVSFLSQLEHSLVFKLKKPKMELENGFLIISIDVDVGNKKLGVMNEGKNDENISKHRTECLIGEIEERVFPLFVDLFDRFEIPVTFAMRGQLMEVDDSMLKILLQSSVKHDIGSHGYYHRPFKNLRKDEVENELKMISVAMNELGVIPKSFVFPKNSVAHLDLLEKYGYKCYRSYGNFLNDGMYIKRSGQLYDVHPSLYLNELRSPMFLKKILDISIARKLPFHIWFHLWNFGKKQESTLKAIDNVFSPMFRYAKKKERDGVLSFETMLSATQKVEKMLKIKG